MEILRAGQPVSPALVEAFVSEMAAAPFLIVAKILLGSSERVEPCPICLRPGSSLGVQDRGGTCYGCNKVTLEMVYNAAYRDDAGGLGEPDDQATPGQHKAAPKRKATVPRALRSCDLEGGRPSAAIGVVYQAGVPEELVQPPTFPIESLKDEHLEMAKPTSLARLQVNGLLDNLREFRLGPVVGDRQRTVIDGVTDKGVFIDGMTADRFLGLTGKLLADSGRIFNYGNSIVYETLKDEVGALTTIAIDSRAESHAAHILANLFVTGHELRTGPVQSLPGPKLAQALLVDESLGLSGPFHN